MVMESGAGPSSRGLALRVRITFGKEREVCRVQPAFLQFCTALAFYSQDLMQIGRAAGFGEGKTCICDPRLVSVTVVVSE